ncbi:hypothetical protein ACFYSC_25475 [Streptosporangium sp. NPDC004379]|uniref:hypothetical protein n=1 Tax=Streptosporangium sp. NPDC004379 TaxID=3366189 RepID=UPI0036D00AD6
MNPGPEGLAGFRPARRTRTGELGDWWSAVTADGRPGGALRFSPELVADPAARRRLAGTVTSDLDLARGGRIGLLPVADLVAAGDDVWLLTSEPAGPTLADLLSEPPAAQGPGAGGAAAVLVETAQTLLALHAAGLAHGALHPGTVVIAADGSALLAERGLTGALRDRPAAPEHDITAWASLAMDLAARWAAPYPEAAGLLERAAATASARGLTQARDVLLAGRDLLPEGFAGRDRLAEAARRRQAEAALAPGLPGPVPGTPPPDEGGIATLLPAAAGGGHAGGDESTVLRFGPGVPAETDAARIWRSGRDGSSGAASRGRRASGGRVRRGRTALASVIIALMVAAGVLAWLFRVPEDPGTPLAVTGVRVIPPKKPKDCSVLVRITGVLSTNGSAGKVRYRWRQSDRRTPVEKTEVVEAGKTSHEVTLRWSINGNGDFRGTATLQVLSPLPKGKKLQDKATFTYRCTS